MIFWMLAHIIHNPQLATNVQKEIRIATRDGALNNATILDLNSSPSIHSVYYEVLRWASAATVVRVVLEDTLLGGYTLRKGAIVMCPARIRHFDPAVWGLDAHSFNADRFFREVDGVRRWRGLERYLRPFGQAPTVCPGRFFAVREVLLSVCEILRRFIIRFDDGENSLPSIKPSSLHSFGSAKPARDIKVVVELRHQTVEGS
jgi:cytochrome P450